MKKKCQLIKNSKVKLRLTYEIHAIIEVACTKDGQVPIACIISAVFFSYELANIKVQVTIHVLGTGIVVSISKDEILKV